MSNQEKEVRTETDLNIWDVIRILRTKIWIIFAAALFAAIGAVGVTVLFITPQYESVTKMYVLTKQNNDVITSQDMQTSLSLTKDYAEMIKSRTVTETVITELGLEIDHEDMLKKMNVDSETDTRVLTISVRDEDPYEACRIADAIRNTAANHIKKVMDIDAVNVVDSANVPKEKISPNIRRNGMLGGIAGILASIVLILLSYMMDDTIETQEDVAKYLELCVLGAVPMSENGRKNKKRRARKA